MTWAPEPGVLYLARDGGAFARADAASPQLDVRELSATRGDGVFEVIGVVEGRPLAAEAHLARLERSCAMLELAAPDRGAIADTVNAAVAEHPPVPELLVKIVISRGVEGRGTPTVWVHAFAAPDFAVARREGVDVVVLDRGYRSDVAATAPWLLQGAKTLSYAVNRAAHREAARRGASDVIFASSDGFVLEGPNSTVVLRLGAQFVTPPAAFGILEGTMQRAAFAALDARGEPTDVRSVGVEELADADAAWLVSSGRLFAPVRSIDGRATTVDLATTERLNALLVAEA